VGFENQELVELNRLPEGPGVDAFTLGRYAQFVKHFPSDARDVLDVGCCAGYGGRVIKSRMPHVRIVGLDIVKARLDEVDPSVYQSTICGFANAIDVPRDSFDVVVAGEVIEHVPSVQVFPTLCELFRVLRLRGRILLTTPNPHYLRNWLQNQSVMSEPHHVSQHTPSSMRRKLEDAGFSRIRIHGSGRMTKYLGQYFPVPFVYGAYLAVATKWR
jgi:2-polyprenyl-3-methyl-5-hydroxy-6-metoxy-1,4-benzoquinol methylase